MTNDEILELIRLAQTSRVAELEVQRGDNRVRIKLSNGQEVTMMAAPYAQAPAAPAAPIAAAPVAPPPPAPVSDPLNDPNLILVKSPIVGTFYESPSPGAAAFVKVGDTVSPGKILCIIESMKLMNEIECEHSGTIVARLVDNQKPVEYGEAMFAIKPN
jgi:acetyl-CoA carboxylase biotin carboxyl carrier protein